MSRYRKKPAVIEAEQWDGSAEGGAELATWCGGTFHAAKVFPKGKDAHWPASIAITTLEGTMYAHEGDFIIRGVQGEHYPCKPDIFEQTYESVE